MFSAQNLSTLVFCAKFSYEAVRFRALFSKVYFCPKLGDLLLHGERVHVSGLCAPKPLPLLLLTGTLCDGLRRLPVQPNAYLPPSSHRVSNERAPTDRAKEDKFLPNTESS